MTWQHITVDKICMPRLSEKHRYIGKRMTLGGRGGGGGYSGFKLGALSRITVSI